MRPTKRADLPGVMAVSYTHLDVYKRQTFFCPNKNAPVGTFGKVVNQFACHKVGTRNILRRGGISFVWLVVDVRKSARFGIIIVTVSYTHLDVYKRQGNDNCIEGEVSGATSIRAYDCPVKEAFLDV